LKPREKQPASRSNTEAFRSVTVSCTAASHTTGCERFGEILQADITSVKVSVNGVPNKFYSQGIDCLDMWNEALIHFSKNDMNGHLRSDMNAKKLYTQDKFGLFIDLRSMRDQEMHGRGLRLENTKDGVQLEINIERLRARAA